MHDLSRRPTLYLLVVVLVLIVSQLSADDDPFERQRRHMVQRQLKARDITDKAVLAAMAAVPRHRFVPTRLAAMAYADQPLPIGHEQTISQPYIVALMTQLLQVKPGQRILEVGTGSGYQAAVLAHMGAQVYSIEIIDALGKAAQKTLAGLGYTGVQIKIGDGYQGWPEHAPFDAIIVTCAPSKIPEPLKDQLAEGGCMVIPVGPSSHQQLVRLTKSQGRITRAKVVDVRFVPMVDQGGKRY